MTNWLWNYQESTVFYIFEFSLISCHGIACGMKNLDMYSVPNVSCNRWNPKNSGYSKHHSHVLYRNGSLHTNLGAIQVTVMCTQFRNSDSNHFSWYWRVFITCWYFVCLSTCLLIGSWKITFVLLVLLLEGKSCSNFNVSETKVKVTVHQTRHEITQACFGMAHFAENNYYNTWDTMNTHTSSAV